MFIYFERDTRRTQVGERQRRRDRIPSRFCAEPVRDHDLSEEQESAAKMTEPPSQPCFFNFFLMVIFQEERERHRVWADEGAERETETQNTKQAPGSGLLAPSPTWGSNWRTTRSWPEPKLDAYPTEPPRCPWSFLNVGYLIDDQEDKALEHRQQVEKWMMWSWYQGAYKPEG